MNTEQINHEEEDSNERDWSEEETQVVGLFSPQTFTNPKAAFEDAKTNHNFDFNALKEQLVKDFYGQIKLVNYVRARHSEGISPNLIEKELQHTADWQDEKYLKTFLEGDSLLFQLDNLPEKKLTADEENAQLKGTIADLKKEMNKMRNDYKKLLYSFQENQKKVSIVTVNQKKETKPEQSPPQENEMDVEQQYYEEENEEDAYFSGYAHMEIHEEMLKDAHRTETYLKSVEHNRDKFIGKTVLDLGCGSGILSLFAAKNGATKVFAIDASDIARNARRVVERNGFSNIIEVKQGKLEEMELPVEKVDIIISEWMGYFLYFESMLSSVIYARDKYLAPGGYLFPCHANLYCFGISYDEMKLHFWRNCYGYDLQDVYTRPHSGHALVIAVDPAFVATNKVIVKTTNVNTVTDAELDFSYGGHMVVTRMGAIDCVGFAFDTLFPNNVLLTTGYETQPTHWYQTCFLLKRPFNVPVGEKLHFDLKASRTEHNKRHYELYLKVWHGNQISEANYVV